jgi:hypothetical protein
MSPSFCEHTHADTHTSARHPTCVPPVQPAAPEDGCRKGPALGVAACSTAGLGFVRVRAPGAFGWSLGTQSRSEDCRSVLRRSNFAAAVVAAAIQ